MVSDHQAFVPAGCRTTPFHRYGTQSHVTNLTVQEASVKGNSENVATGDAQVHHPRLSILSLIAFLVGTLKFQSHVVALYASSGTVS